MTRPPGGVNLKALSTRLVSTWIRRWRSHTTTSGEAGALISRAIPLAAASDANSSAASSNTLPTSWNPVRTVRRPASMLLMSRRSSIIARICCAARWTRRSCPALRRRSSPGALLSMLSTLRVIPISGFLRSCETNDSKSSRALTARWARS